MENKTTDDLINELKTTKLKLEEIENQYKALIDNSLIGVYSTNIDGDILFANKGLANILGYDSVEELKNSKSKSFYKNPEQRELLLSKLEKYKKVTNFEAELISKDKKIKHVLLNSYKYNNQIIGMLLDISIRKTYLNDLMKAQEELEKMNEELENRVNKRTKQLEKSYLQLIKSKIEIKESEEKFKSIVENVSDLIFIIDKKGILTFVSPSCKDLLGYETNEVIGKNLYDFLTNNDKEQLKIIYKELLKNEHKMEEQVFKLKHKDNIWKWFITSGSLIKNKKEKIFFFLGIAKDITKRRKEEEILHQSEKKFRAIIESSNEGIIAVSEKTKKIIYSNPAFSEMLDYSVSELLNMDVFDLNPNVAHSYFDFYFEELNKKKEIKIKPFELLTKNKKKVITDINIIASELFGENVYFAFIKNITEKIKAEEQIKILSTAVEQSPTAIFITDNKGKITYVNQQFVKITGYTSQEAIGKTPSIIKSGKYSKDYYKLMWNTILSGKVWEDEILNKKKTGELFWAHQYITPIKNSTGEITNFLSIQRDTTQKKLSSDALKESEERLKIIFDTAAESIILINELGMIENINKAGLVKFGYKFEELVGQNVSCLMPEPHKSKHNEYIKRYLKTKVPHAMGRSLELKGLKKDGEVFPILISLSEFQTDKSTKFVGVISDITDLKKSQEQLVQAGKMAALGQLIAGIAHEINSPLGAIKSQNDYFGRAIAEIFRELPELISKLPSNIIQLMSNLIEEAINNPLDLSSQEERKKKRQLINIFDEMGINTPLKLASNFVNIIDIDKVETYKQLLLHKENTEIFNVIRKFVNIKNSSNIIHNATDSIMRIVLALKTYAHSDDSEEPIEADITKGIDTVLTLFHNKTKHAVTISKEYSFQEPILCFPDELNQVWTNLIHNALQAMDFKGSLDIKVYKDNNYIVATFKDSGKGIPEEIRDKIFKPFFTTKPPGEGSGLGLDIIKKIVEKHKGKLTFESKVNEGTTFIVKLPINNLG